MSWWKIAWRSMQQRGVASTLTGLSMALGVMLVVMVLTIHGTIAKSFQTGSSVGYNMLVGARGGSLQLVLNTVFYLSKPIETIPYDYYLSFADPEVHQNQMRHSAAFQAEYSWNQTMQMQDQLSLGMPGAGALALLDQPASTVRNDQNATRMYRQVDRFNFYVRMVIPVCLGDTFGEESQYRVVATTPAFFNELEINVDTGEHLKFREGRAFEQWNAENGVFEAVIGEEVATSENLKVGDVIRPIHGDIATGGHEHRTEFKLVGILERSGTRNDAAVFINLEGFYLMNDHIKPLEDEMANVGTFEEEEEPADELLGMTDEQFNSELDQLESMLDEGGTLAKPNDSDAGETKTQVADAAVPSSAPVVSEPDGKGKIYLPPLPIEQRELTALLVRGNDDTGAGLIGLENAINTGGLSRTTDWSKFRNQLSQKSAQAVNPLGEITTLLDLFVAPMQMVLLILTITICIVSGIGILVSIYNSMSDRKQEIAIMRALGADQTTVMGVVLAESIMLSLMGGLAGWVAAHAAFGLAAPIIKDRAGVLINPFSFAPGISIPGLPGIELSSELLLVPGLILLAILVGLLPAISAYRTDVSENLS